MGIENEDYYQLKRCDCDITPNSHDFPTKYSIVLGGRMNILILGTKGLNFIENPKPKS